MNKTLFLLFLTAMFVSSMANAQRWKRMRYEWSAGIGASNFLGELGGANRIGTNFIYDFDFPSTRPTLSAGVRYKITNWLSWKSSLTYGWLYGNDKFTKEENRNYRNLHFRTPIVELSTQIEPAIIKEQVGSQFRLRGLKGRKTFMINTYPFVGIALFWFNPRAKCECDGKWHNLQPLATEGQGLTPTRKKYKRVQIAIPFGIGFKYGFRQSWSIGLEYGIRKTFTDYIDDVSMTYYDYASIEANTGYVARELANTSDKSKSNTGKDNPGQQRGDPTDNDAYMFMTITASKKFRWKKRKRSRPKF